MTDPAPETPAEGDVPQPQPKRFLFLRRKESTVAVDAPVPDETTTPDTGAADGDASPDRIRPGVLKRRRRQLTGQYEQGIFDLGGLAMELHSRGLLAEDVMRRRAAEVADIRAQVDELTAELDQLRQDRQERRQSGRGDSVQCPACGFRSRSTANFCASCGAPLKVEADQPTTVIVEEQVTTVIVEEDPQPTVAIPPQGKDGA
jgi:hypothetical protein